MILDYGRLGMHTALQAEVALRRLLPFHYEWALAPWTAIIWRCPDYTAVTCLLRCKPKTVLFSINVGKGHVGI